jgi:ribonuclease P protein component
MGCRPNGTVNDEAHLSAEEAQTRSYARISCSHADTGRAHGAQTPARERAQAADRVMRGRPGNQPRPKRGRLSRSADFDRVFRQGSSHGGRELVLYVFPRGEDPSTPRLGLSVSRKVGGAVQRNQVKRLLREAFALDGDRLPAGSDVVVVARTDARGLAEREGLAGIRRALADLIDRVERSGGGTA